MERRRRSGRGSARRRSRARWGWASRQRIDYDAFGVVINDNSSTAIEQFMIQRSDRESWRRRQRFRRWNGIVIGVCVVVFAQYLVRNAIAVVQTAYASPEAKEMVKQAFRLGWDGVSQTQVYAGYQIWIRDVIGGAILNAMLLVTVIVVGLIARQAFRREERMWAHIESLEAQLGKPEK